MMLVRSVEEATAIDNPKIRSLVLQRIAVLSEDEPYDPRTMAHFAVLEDGDATSAISALLGFDILSNRVTGIRFDQPGFHCSFEMLEEHPTCFEILFILSEDGYGVDVFVPKGSELPPDLLAMCSMYSVPSPEDLES